MNNSLPKEIKQRVKYDGSKGFHIQVGMSALIHPIDHPSYRVSNGSLTQTSTVLSYDEETGVFETLNTIYERT